MNIIYNINNDIKISFEFFPPKNEFLENSLFKTAKKLSFLKPRFFSVTHSPYQNNINRTNKIVNLLRNITPIPVIPHLTCIGLKIKDLSYVIKKYWLQGIQHILALRGDVISPNIKVNMYALDLIKILKKIENFEISVAAYPELHPESRNIKQDLLNLKKKVDAGATRAITQFFFDVNKFFKFRDLCHFYKIDVELVPGILPILSLEQLKNFSSITNVSIPINILKELEKFKNNINKHNDFAVKVSVNLIKKLYREGIYNFHFYTLNRFDLSFLICKKIGILK